MKLEFLLTVITILPFVLRTASALAAIPTKFPVVTNRKKVKDVSALGLKPVSEEVTVSFPEPPVPPQLTCPDKNAIFPSLLCFIVKVFASGAFQLLQVKVKFWTVTLFNVAKSMLYATFWNMI